MICVAKMNALRDYNPRLYEILEIEPRLLSKAQLSKELNNWFKKNNTKITTIQELFILMII